MLFEKLRDFWFVMERRIVHDDQACGPEHGQQHLLDPCGHGQMGAAFVEQHGRNPVFATLRHDEVGAPAFIAGDFAENFPPPGRPAMRAMRIGLKTTLVKVDHIAPAMFGDPGAELAEKRNSFFATTFSIPRRFFW